MKNRTKTISLLLALCMMLTLLPAMALEQYPPLWVGGVQVTSANASDILDDDKVSYEVATNTLTLNNATITGYYTGSGGDVYGIYYGNSAAPLTINLIGDNTIIGQQGTPNSNTDTGSSYGICSADPLIFTGSGSLSVSSADATGGNSWSVAIYAYGDITVGNSCTITASCGTAKDIEAAIYPTLQDTLIKGNSTKITASINANGSDPVASYEENKLRTYKYLRIEPTTYTVTFDRNGGTGDMAPVSGVYGEYTLPANGFTPPANYKFKWWWVNKNSFHDSDEVIQVTDNVTLTAVWTKLELKTYSVSFSAGVAQGFFTGSMKPQTFTEGVAQAISPNAFVREGYEFTGWVDQYGNSYTDGKTVKLDETIMINGDGLTLTAQWKENTPGTTGGGNTGGNTPGGNTPGGNTPGGNTPGGNTPGGNNPGGNTPGGNTTPGTVDPGTSSGISLWYNGGNSFGSSNSAVPTSVEIDGVPVVFNGNGREFTVGCISPNAKWVTVNWNSTSVTTNFTPDANATCAEISLPKTGDVSVMAFALMAVVAAAGAMGKK